MSTKLLNEKQVCKDKVGFSRATLYDAIKRGIFPRPIKISAMRNAWLESEIDEWIAKRAAERTVGADE